MKILLIGSGGREHALAHTFYKKGHRVFCLPGNPGTDQLSFPFPKEWKTLDISRHERLAAFAKSEGFELTVVGPEAPLAEGIVDVFVGRGLKIFGPNKQAAELESSKIFAKKFMAKHKIPTAPFFVCESSLEALKLLPECFAEWPGVVIKPDGLTAGKGVIPCDSIETAKETVRLVMEQEKFGSPGKKIILEKTLFGPEVSILAFCDGKAIVPMLPSQDHKRLLDFDEGPNTGGVGALCPLPFLTEEDMNAIKEEIIEKTLAGLKREKIDYKGVIYFGLMLTSEGPKVLEYNCRFGDPEAQAVLPLLKSDLGEIMLSCIEGKLAKERVTWSDQSSCCVVLTSKGYPEKYETGYEIRGLTEIPNTPGIYCFHSGTRQGNNHTIITNGGRVLGITAVADDLQSARKRAYEGVSKIYFEGMYYRKDIGKKAMILTSGPVK